MQLQLRNGLLKFCGLSEDAKMNEEAATASNNMGVSTKGAPMKPQPLILNGEAKPKRGRGRGRGSRGSRGGRGGGRGRPKVVQPPVPVYQNEVFEVEDEFFSDVDFEQRDPDTKSLDSLDQANSYVEDEVDPVEDTIEDKVKVTVKVIGESASSGSSTPTGSSPMGSRTSSPRGVVRGRGGRGRGRPPKKNLNGLLKLNGNVSKLTKLRGKSLEEENEHGALVKQLAQQVKVSNGDLSGLEGSPMMSPKVLINNMTNDLNSLEDTKAEIQKRLDSFEHIRENVFLCARRCNKQSLGMECDCTLSKEDHVKGTKGCGDDCLNRMLMIECSKSCSLGKCCGNKRFQNIENAPTEVFKTAYKGVGLRATADLPADSFIMEYVGEVLDYNKFRKRAKKYSKDDAQHFYFMALSSEHYIDASNKGNISRFINHSCSPNAETQKWTVNGELRVGFFSKKFIAKGDEVTFDYKYERYGQEAQKCFCNTEKCRGWLGGDPEADDKEEASEDEEASEEDEEDEEESTESSESSEEEIVPEKPPEKPVVQAQPETVIEEPVEVKEVKIPEVKPASVQDKIRSLSPLPKPRKMRRKRKLRKSPRKIKNYENYDEEEDLEKLTSTGIRTKVHTLALCRLMHRTTDLKTKLLLSTLLIRADSPCKKLFIDYRGLQILGNWIVDLATSGASTVTSEVELDLMQAVEDALAVLVIPDKQVLTETKIWQTMTKWSALGSDAKSELNKVESVAKPALESSLMNGELVHTDEKSKAIAETLHEQEVEKQNVGLESIEENTKNEVEAIERKEAKDDTVSNETNEKQEEIRKKAATILESWSHLQEVKFKIPKQDRALQRSRHEAEVEQAAAKIRIENPEHSMDYDPAKFEMMHSRPWSYYEKWPSNHKPQPDMSHPPPPIFRKRQRPSRFDDQTGVIHQPRIDRNALRHLFTKKTELERCERQQRENLIELHRHKCKYLCLNPDVTPLFPQFPEFYYNPEFGQWFELPPFMPDSTAIFPPFHPDNYPRMANMPIEAFRERDEPLPDPAKIYPPGVVAISYFFGPPMSLDPRYADFGENQKKIQEEMPITYIDPVSGYELPIPELSPEEFEVLDKKRPKISSMPSLDDFEVKPSANPENSGKFLPLFDGDDKAVEEDIRNLLDFQDMPLPGKSVIAPNLPTISLCNNARNPDVRIKLRPGWKTAKDSEGRIYYYNRITKETQWDPPVDENPENLETSNTTEIDLETASTASEDEDDLDNEEDGEDTDDEEEDMDCDKDPEIRKNPEMVESDLSEQEKEVLLKSYRGKTKEERQHERRQKREQNREKREYEKKRRRERHVKHRREGLVTEHLIPRRTEKEKGDLMTFEEMRNRLANRDAIREKQEAEERAEEEREFEEAARLRREQRELERSKSDPSQTQRKTTSQIQIEPSVTAAAADTSSEVERKIKERFLKETSKVVVKVLDPYRRDETSVAKIKNVEDFKHLAKKLTNYIMTKELKHTTRIEDLKCNERVKKKTAEFVRKYMSKFGEEYKRSPNGNH